MEERWLVRSWMSSPVRTIAPGDSLIDAFELMRLHRIRHLPVVDRGHVVGIISDRDLRSATPARAGVTNGHRGTMARAASVASAMTPAPRTIAPGATIGEASDILRAEKIGALPVLDGEGQELVGIVSYEDLLRAFEENTKAIVG